MQPALPEPAEPTTSTTSSSHAPLPSGILAGLALALAAMAVAGGAAVWDVLGRPALASTASVVTMIEVSATFGASQETLLGLGLFLIYGGLSRLLPGSAPWARRGAYLVLVGTLVVVAGYLGSTIVFVSLYSTNGSYFTPLIYNGVYALEVAGGIALSSGTVAALYGIARGALARRTST